MKVKCEWHEFSKSWILSDGNHAISFKTAGGKFQPPFESYPLEIVFREYISMYKLEEKNARLEITDEFNDEFNE